MINTDFNSIFELFEAFPDEQSCIDHLEQLRWNGNVISPFDRDSKVYKCKKNRYRCKNTGKYFNVKTKTLFDSSKVPLRKWFVAIWLVTSHKKGISSIQLGKDVGVTQKTAWFILQRIRACFGLEKTKEEPLKNQVEIDETYVGGKNKNRHSDKKIPNSQGRSVKAKVPVVGMIERKGRLVALVTTGVRKKHLTPIAHQYIDESARVFTDEWIGYNDISKTFEHAIVNHGKKQYVNGDAHTNTIEGFWSLMKRGILGIYHKVSRKHMQKYVDEFVFRYNTKNETQTNRMNSFFDNLNCRTTYKSLVGT